MNLNELGDPGNASKRRSAGWISVPERDASPIDAAVSAGSLQANLLDRNRLEAKLEGR